MTANALKHDPIDPPYFWFGVQDFLRLKGIESDLWHGEIGFVDACLEYVDLLNVPTGEHGLPGVFAYEVAQPFGFFVAKELAEKRELRKKVAELEVARLIAEAEGSIAT